MYRVILTLAILLTGSIAYATPANERVAPPNDHGKQYLTVLGDEADPTFRQVKEWFRTDPQLVAVKNQMHFNVYAKGTVMYDHRYGATTGGLTTIRVQDASGRVIYEAKGMNIPRTPDQLASDLSTNCFLRRWRQRHQQCPDGQCPVPSTPDQEIQPLDPPPIVAPAPPRGPNYLIIGLSGLGGLVVGAAFGLGKSYREQYYAAG